MRWNRWLHASLARPHPGRSTRLIALVVGLVGSVHAGLWALDYRVLTAPNIQGPLASLSYTRLEGSADGRWVTPAQIHSDLAVLAPHTGAVRTYASTGGLEFVPVIANEFGLTVSVGAWIDKDEQRCQQCRPRYQRHSKRDNAEVGGGFASGRRNIEQFPSG